MERLATKRLGFTLVETIIYIALFSIIFVGIFVSIFPIFTNAERLTQNIATEGESAFILSKINYALRSIIIDPRGTISTPGGNQLVLSYNGVEQYRFAMDTSGTFCDAPLLCQMLTLSTSGGAAVPLNASRVNITNFTVQETAPTGNSPRYVDVSFDANGVHIGPVRYYLTF